MPHNAMAHINRFFKAMNGQLVNCKSSLTYKCCVFGARAIRVSQKFNKNQFYCLHNVQRSRRNIKEVTMLLQECIFKGQN